MPDPTVQKIQQWLRDHEFELLEDYRSMLRIPSIQGPAKANAPFGLEVRRALDLGLNLAGKFGMRTTDLDGYIGYGEIGAGPLVLTIGHLDVVPVGPGWRHEPFGAEIDGDYVYARGAKDDKGPTMASLYAVRALRDCVPDLKCRVRQVFGCNEESGFGCVEHYMAVDEAPVFGLAPDSWWPLVHAEKGISNLSISLPLNDGEFRLLEVTGGQRPNIVIDSCLAKVQVGAEERAEVEAKLADAWDRNVTWQWKGDLLEIEAIGKAAHGSAPFFGDSAAARVFRFLLALAPIPDAEYFRRLFYSAHPGGCGIGIDGRDDVSDDLTCNLGVVQTSGGRVRLEFNVRYPVTWKGEHLRNLCLKYLEDLDGWTLDSYTDSPSLNFPLDHPLVTTIVDVYEEEAGERLKPKVMGGGTYARAIPNTVSIGACWEGDGKAHETDERLKIAHLYRLSRIYAHILYRLSLIAES